MRKKTLILICLVSLSLFFSVTAQSAWDVRPGETLYQHSPGESFTVEIKLNSSGSDIDALGFDFHFPAALLDFNSADFSGTLLNAWMYKDTNLMSAGLLRVAGFTTTGIIVSPAQGILVKLNFTVKAGASGEDQMITDSFTDDLSGATTGAATFRVPGDQLLVSAPDTSGTPGETIDIPIFVEDLTGKGILALMMTVSTQTSVLTPIKASVAGTVLEPWGSVTANISGGDITIGGASISPLTGSGILVFIQYQVNAAAQDGQTTPIDIVSVLFNEGNPAAIPQDGLFTVYSGYNISGAVNYYKNNKPVPDVTVTLNGNQTLTDNNGAFSFAKILGGNYTLTPSKIGELGTSISPFDASMILRFSVGLIELTPYQKIAADVSGNGNISPYDASYVLRYSVGLITEFPVGSDWTFVPASFTISETNWNTAPDNISYSHLNADQTDQDFMGIIYGDVSGNWLNSNLAGSTNSVEIKISNIKSLDNGNLFVPLELKFSDETFSGQFKLIFDNSNLEFVSSVNQNDLSDVIFASAVAEGAVDFAFAFAHSLADQKIKVNLIFKKINQPNSSSFDFEFTDVTIDDKFAFPTVVKNYQKSQLPADYELGDNFPNPFNPETSIKYRIPKTSQVTIEVFNQLGQRVQTLVNEKKPAGTYHAKWNGLDESGQAVVSGVYFYRMQAGDFSAMRKMALVR